MMVLALTTQNSLTIVAVCQLVATLAVVALAGGLLYVVFAFKRMISTRIDQVMAEGKPSAESARSMAEEAKRVADNASEKVDAMMTTAEDAATSIGNTLQSVSKRVDEAVNPQVVAIAGLVGTIAKCVQACRDASTICHAPEAAPLRQAPHEEQPAGEE